MLPIHKKVKNSQQNGTISENGQNFSTKIVPFQSEKVIIPRQKNAISEKGRNSSTKMVPFQKRVKRCQQKKYHFIRGENANKVV